MSIDVEGGCPFFWVTSKHVSLYLSRTSKHYHNVSLKGDEGLHCVGECLILYVFLITMGDVDIVYLETGDRSYTCLVCFMLSRYCELCNIFITIENVDLELDQP